SAVAANDVLVYDRGRIAEGLAADVIVFDYDKLTDKATFAEPDAVSQGMRHVIVNGALVLKDGEMTDARPGRVLRGPGYRPESAPSGISTGPQQRLASFDAMVREFLTEHCVPGGAVAVTDQGRLVHAAGYGYADIAAREPVQPTSLFRIASLSKPITAVAILQLVEQEKLKLDERVFDVLDEFHADIDKANDSFEKRLKDVTIRHLLEHRGGWDRDKSFDAMF